MSSLCYAARARLAAVAWMTVSAGTASAQSIAGSLLRADSTPAAGVIVLARTLTGGNGRYTLDLPPGVVRLRALRIGQRPFVIGTFDMVPGVAVAAVFEEAREALLSTPLRSNERRPVVRTSTYSQNRTLGDREVSPRELLFVEGESLKHDRGGTRRVLLDVRHAA